MRLDRIVIGMDFSPPAVAAARWVRRHVAPDAELVLVHAICIPEPPAVLRGRFRAPELLVDTERVGADQRLREVRQSLGSERVRVEVRVGEPGQEILATARRLDSDLIVLGAQPRRAVRRALFGSVANEVLRGAECPVLAIAEPVGEIDRDT